MARTLTGMSLVATLPLRFLEWLLRAVWVYLVPLFWGCISSHIWPSKMALNARSKASADQMPVTLPEHLPANICATGFASRADYLPEKGNIKSQKTPAEMASLFWGSFRPRACHSVVGYFGLRCPVERWRVGPRVLIPRQQVFDFDFHLPCRACLCLTAWERRTRGILQNEFPPSSAISN